MTIDVIIEADGWRDAGLNGLAQRAFDAVAADFSWAPGAYEAVLLGCDDARIATLNADFRGKARPTNVLSWPTAELDGPTAAPDDAELGDIAIAYETCVREAQAQGKPLDAHVLHLIVHGLLHLLGFDHEIEHEAARMERKEVEILAKLGVPNPYEEAG